MSTLNPYHFLMGCRADNWLRLLKENRFSIAPDRLPEALLISATSALMFPVGAAERLIYGRRIENTVIEKDPVFILGHWRSGTTYLQNILSRDPQFGWFDPVNTVVSPYSLTAGSLLTKTVSKGIAHGRPMDNVQYSLDLPMEETFAVLTLSTGSICNLIAFPEHYEQYLAAAFVEDLPPDAFRRWQRTYDHLLKKLTYVNHGKQLILKSPDNTARADTLLRMYPDARFINIHRDPYKTIRSTVHMFVTQTEAQRLTREPDNMDELIEDIVVSLFGRMYKKLFALVPTLPENRYAEFAYKDFCADPVGSLEAAYRKLELPGFANARGAFAAYAAEQKSFVKNSFTITPRLCRKINDNLGFYFEHYGYEMREV